MDPEMLSVPNRFFVGFAGARAMVASWDAACSVLCLWILYLNSLVVEVTPVKRLTGQVIYTERVITYTIHGRMNNIRTDAVTRIGRINFSDIGKNRNYSYYA